MSNDVFMPAGPSMDTLVNSVQSSIFSIGIIFIIGIILLAILSGIVIAIIFAVKKSSKNK